jgi:hypothetical protein
MKSQLVTVAFLLSAFSSSAQENTALRSNVHIGFAYPLSTNGVKAGLYTNKFSAHALFGLSFQEEAFCAAGIASVITQNVHGLVASVVVNVIGSNVSGLAAAGIYNYAGKNVHGVQAAGVLNMAHSINGVQAAGFANLAQNGVSGAQLAGFANITDTAHTQISGFTNIAHETKAQIGGFLNLADSADVQISGFINVSEKCDAQVGGFINVAKEVNGTQVAGFINVARRVKGVQLSGFVNIADSSECPIGIINIIGNGEQALGVTANEIGTTIATFRSGGRKLYGIIGVGGNFTNRYEAFALQAGLGMHIPVSTSFRFNTEVSVTSLSDRRFNTDLRSSFKFLPALRLGRVELFAGPTFSYTTTSDNQGLGRVGYSLWSKERYYQSQDLSIGFESGIQYHLNSKKLFNKIFSEKKVEN